MTVALPHFDEDDRRQSNWEEILRRLIDTGGQSIGVRFGADTLAWPGVAAATSNTKLVAHGLGKVPIVVICAAYVPAANTVTRGIDIEADDALFNTTDFTCRGIFGNGVTSSATWPFCWIAIG
jgi:hypothetical protein